MNVYKNYGSYIEILCRRNHWKLQYVDCATPETPLCHLARLGTLVEQATPTRHRCAEKSRWMRDQAVLPAI